MENLAVLSALPVELNSIRKLMHESISESWSSTIIISGYIGNNKVITLATGVGKVRAAATVQFVIDRYSPTAVLFIGAAGALHSEIEPGDVIIGERLVEHDFDIQALAAKSNEKIKSWKPNAVLFRIAFEACRRVVEDKKVRIGVILTGDQVIVDREKRTLLREIFNGDCIEMEGAAVANICNHNNIPFVVIRIVSDFADHNAPIHFNKMLDFISLLSSRIIRELLKFDFHNSTSIETTILEPQVVGESLVYACEENPSEVR